MEENYLQAGFEIKLACDALSRRILRWHWERLPRPNTLKELMRYVEQRSVEAPEYYLNITAQKGDAANWQKLDTTFCMRVLLDAEANAAQPKKLLQYALNEGAARHACNGLRIARNAAAHATDKEAVVKAIAVFDDTLIDLDNAYGLTLFAAGELEQYDALVQSATAACSASPKAKPAAKAAPKAVPKPKETPKATRARAPQKAQGQGSTKSPARSAKQAQPQKPAPKNSVSREFVFACLAVVVFLAALCVQLAR